jgi:hypothetical protein
MGIKVFLSRKEMMRLDLQDVLMTLYTARVSCTSYTEALHRIVIDLDMDFNNNPEIIYTNIMNGPSVKMKIEWVVLFSEWIASPKIQPI